MVRTEATQAQKLARAEGLLAEMEREGALAVEAGAIMLTKRQVLNLIAVLKEEPPIDWLKPSSEFEPWHGNHIQRVHRRSRQGVHMEPLKWRAEVDWNKKTYVGPSRRTKAQARRDVEDIRRRLNPSGLKPQVTHCPSGHLYTRKNARLNVRNGKHLMHCRRCDAARKRLLYDQEKER